MQKQVPTTTRKENALLKFLSDIYSLPLNTKINNLPLYKTGDILEEHIISNMLHVLEAG